QLFRFEDIPESGIEFRLIQLMRFGNDNSEVSSEYLLQDNKGYSGRNYQKSILGAKFVFSPNQSGSAYNASLFGQLTRNKRHDFIVDELKFMEPKLSNLTTIFIEDVPSIYADIGMSELIPLNALGDGVVRLTNILLEIGVNENGIVLIDEIENGFHYSILADVWKA